MMPFKSSDLLIKLRSQLLDQKLSVLVGAGFSKNVSDKFLNWNELLYDLTVELKGDAIEQSYERYLRDETKEIEFSKSDFMFNEVKKILSKEKPAKVVAEYIAFREREEAIVTYIEARTPNAQVISGNKLQLVLGTTIEEIPFERLALHQALVKLPWKDVYTTNYDELLDISIDHQGYEALGEEIDLAEQTCYQMANLIESLNDQLKENELKIESLRNLKNGSIDIVGTDIRVDEQSPDLETLQKLSRKLSWDISDAKSKSIKFDELLEQKRMKRRSAYVLVKSASDLIRTGKGNLVKLHGSLRSPAERQQNQGIHFDGDYKTQYVISQAHYDEYPKKHDAFYQLMGLSMLKDNLCMIGFSGNDPNFRLWVDWVVDISHKHSHPKQTMPPQSEFYLIDVELDEPDVDTVLYYNNRRIRRIPIRSDESIAFLQSITGLTIDKNDHFSVFKALLKFLANDSATDVTVPEQELGLESERQAVWRKLSFFDPDKSFDMDLLTETTDKLDAFIDVPLIPNLEQSRTMVQDSLVKFASSILIKNASEGSEHRLKLLKLLLLSIKDYRLPILDVLTTDQIAECRLDPELSALMRPMLERQQLIKQKVVTENSSLEYNHAYHQALHYAFNFDFQNLKRFMDSWQPSGTNVLQKAGLLALYDLKASERLLKSALKDDSRQQLSAEHKLYLYEMLNYIGFADTLNRDPKIIKIIENFQKAGLSSIYDNFSQIEQTLATKVPSLERSRRGSSDLDLWDSGYGESKAVQCLMLLIDSGFQLCIPNRVFIQHGNWEKIVMAGFRFYPYAFLFYSLQYSNDKFLRKLGQEYASSDPIAADLKQICVNLLLNNSDLPFNIRENSYYFLSEALVAVDPESWELGVLRIWKRLIKEPRAFTNRRPATSAFISNTLIYIKDIQILFDFIADCLDPLTGLETNQAISFMYYIGKNSHFKQKADIASTPQPVALSLQSLINSLPNSFEPNFFMLANLSRLLSESQKDELASRLNIIDYNKIRNVRIWRLIIYYSQGNTIVLNKVKKALLKHDLLWYTGIRGNTVHGMFDHLNIMAFTNNTYNPRGLKWTKREVVKLYQKLVFPLSEIRRMNSPNDFMRSFSDVLEDMVSFMDRYKAHLLSLSDFQYNYNLALSLHHDTRKFVDLSEGLMSDDSVAIYNAMSELSIQIYKNSCNKDNLQIFIYRTLLQVGDDQLTELSYLSTWLADDQQFDLFRDYMPQILLLLLKYKNYQTLENIPYLVLEKLIHIVLSLKKNGYENEMIDYWISMTKSSRFNNVRVLTTVFVNQACN